MKMFSKVFKKNRKQAEADQARERLCMIAVGDVLKAHNCMLEPVLKGDARSMFADLQITALPNDARPTAAEPATPAAREAKAKEGSETNQPAQPSEAR